MPTVATKLKKLCRTKCWVACTEALNQEGIVFLPGGVRSSVAGHRE
jgi:hypothetical protein